MARMTYKKHWMAKGAEKKGTTNDGRGRTPTLPRESGRSVGVIERSEKTRETELPINSKKKIYLPSKKGVRKIFDENSL